MPRRADPRARRAAPRVRLALALGLALAPLAGPAPAEEARAFARALGAAQAKDWQAAEAAARASGPLAADLVAWHRLRAGAGGTLADYAAFLARRPGWPGLDLLRERAESAIGPATPDAEVLAWFGAEGVPLTGAGLRRLAAALAARDGREAAAARLGALWAAATVPLEPADEAALIADWAGALAPLHEARARAVLDRGDWPAALRLVERLPEAARDFVSLRIDLQRGGPDLQTRIDALPAAAQDDPGLNLDRYRRFLKAKDAEHARERILARSGSAAALGDPAAWAQGRADQARAALRAGDPRLALRLAGAHFLTPEHPLWTDLEWLAGYAALEAGDLPEARRRFEALAGGSTAAITQSRALYWQARVAERAGDRAAAEALMRRAAVHQTTFYGQLAAEAAGVAMDPALALAGPGLGTVPDWRAAAIRLDDRVQAGLWLLATGAPDLAQRFLLAAAGEAPGEDVARLARLMAEFGQTHHALRLAKLAAQKGAVHPAVLFPLTGLEEDALGIPPELALAIARRESEFNPRAASPAGAKGLMQVMPATAREIAGDVGLPYDARLLASDPDYNALYGATYLTGLRARFGPSIALVAAGYNAGPGRSAQWLRALGEIRGGADPVAWVEAIPFDETRNYVMRVAEALPVYRARIAGRPVPLTPTDDLTGGGVRSIPVPQPVLALEGSARPRANPRGPFPDPEAPAAAVATAAPPVAPSAVPAGAAAFAETAPAAAPGTRPSIPPPAALD